jgi:hypothetical protein
LQGQFFDSLSNRRIRFHDRFGLAACVQYGGVVAIPKISSDLLQAVSRQATSEKHGDASRSHDSLLPRGTAEIGQPNFEVLADMLGDRSDLGFDGWLSRIQAAANLLFINFLSRRVGTVIQSVQDSQQLGHGYRLGG